ncbi:MAG: class I SAM-dependent methyltransferase [Rhodovibrionaceae bacterium]
MQERDYWRCGTCEVRFLDPEQLPIPEEELAHYRQHENDPGDARHRKFLSRLAEPLLARLERGRQGLDYGCGPDPTLAAMLRESGQEVALYDPFFRRDRAALERSYDFIVCSETAEHFHRPAEEFARFRTLLRPGGWLAVMTCFQNDDAAFADWHYRRDPTHVIFYRELSFRWIAARFGWRCEIPGKDVALLRKPPEDAAV